MIYKKCKLFNLIYSQIPQQCAWNEKIIISLVLQHPSYKNICYKYKQTKNKQKIPISLNQQTKKPKHKIVLITGKSELSDQNTRLTFR